MKQKYSYLKQNVMLFSLSLLLPKLLAFILVPIYTSYLSADEYGMVDIIQTTVQLIIPILTLDIQDAVLRYALDEKYDKKDVLSIAFSLIIVGLSILIIGIVFVKKLTKMNIESFFYLFLVVMFLTSSLNSVLSFFLRAIDKVSISVFAGIINSIVMLVSNIIFLVLLKLGIKGYLYASILGAVIAILISFFGGQVYKYITFKIKVNTLKEMLKYSFPLIFSAIAWWINNSSDRYIVTGFLGLTASGIYAVSYKIPNLLTSFQNVFYQAWSISAIKEFDKNDEDGFIGNMFSMMNFSMIVVGSFLMIFSIPLSKILFSKEFFSAWKYISPLIVSVIFNAMALFVGGIFTAVRDTKTLSFSTIIGAIVNIILNFISIPFLGIYGAAVATYIGYATTYLIRILSVRKYINMKYNRMKTSVSYILISIQMIWAFGGIKSIVGQLIVLSMILALYIREIKFAVNKIWGMLRK